VVTGVLAFNAVQAPTPVVSAAATNNDPSLTMALSL
jgi:hypothetical protein